MTDVAIPFLPFDRQLGPIYSEAPIVACISGARGGKTQTGAFLTAAAAVTQDGYSLADRKTGEPYVIGVGAPTYPLLNRVILPTVLRYIPDWLKLAPYHQTNRLLRVRGQYGETHIYFISARFWESWYGLKLSYAWIDEFALIKETMYDELQTRLSDVKGRLLLTGTPQGPNWAHSRLYEQWRTGVDRWGQGGTIDFHQWTTLDNPYIDAAFIESKRRTMPKRYFDRTFLATWDTFEGQIYEEFLREVHVRRYRDYTFLLPRRRRVGVGTESVPLKVVIAGVDWGYGDGHPGVIVVLGLDYGGRWWLLEESVAERVLVMAEPMVDSWIVRGRGLATKWGIETFFCDTENPAAIAQFRKAGLKATGAVKDVIPGIETVASRLHIDEESLEPRLVILDGCSTTVDEFTYYHWEQGKEKPAKVQDHCMDAVRYALHTYQLRGNFRREPNFGKVPV